MEYLITILFITHIVTLFKLRQFLMVYKEKNQIYINSELDKIRDFFSLGVTELQQQLEVFKEDTQNSLVEMNTVSREYTQSQKGTFYELVKTIKEDYTSLTKLVNNKNIILEDLLKQTQQNIIKNKELTPLLKDSNTHLEKVYSKVKQYVNNCEKSLMDTEDNLNNTFEKIIGESSSKIKQLITTMELNIQNIQSSNITVVEETTQLTKAHLNKVLNENYSEKITQEFQKLEAKVLEKTDHISFLTLQSKTDLESFISKIENKDNKKNFLGF